MFGEQTLAQLRTGFTVSVDVKQHFKQPLVFSENLSSVPLSSDAKVAGWLGGGVCMCVCVCVCVCV